MPHMVWAVVILMDGDKVLPPISSSIHMNTHTHAHAGRNSACMGLHTYATCVHIGVGNTCAPVQTHGRSGTSNMHTPSRYVWVHSCVNEVPQRSGPQDVFRALVYRERVPPYNDRESFFYPTPQTAWVVVILTDNDKVFVHTTVRNMPTAIMH